jgi:hypothetical protein
MNDDQLAKWKAALAAHNRQQRAQRWKRKAPAIGPGRLRVTTVRAGEVDGDTGEREGGNPQAHRPTGGP